MENQEKRNLLFKALDGKTIQGIVTYPDSSVTSRLELLLNSDDEDEEVRVTIDACGGELHVTIVRNSEVDFSF